MDKGIFVAINLTLFNKVVNPSNTPLIYYWNTNEDDNVKNELIKSEEFVKYLTTSIMEYNDYGKAIISYCYYTYKNEYVEKSELIQTFLPVEIQIHKFESLALGHFNFLYNCSYKKNFEYSGVFEKDIINIYDSIKDKHPQKVVKSTVINYVRSQLQQVNNLTTDNINVIIDILEKILVNKE